MSNKLEDNISKAKNDFNKVAQKKQTEIGATENGKATASQVQIDELEKQRPKLQNNLNLPAPGGSKAQGVDATAAARAKNNEITRKQNEFRARMQAQKGKAKESFERSK